MIQIQSLVEKSWCIRTTITGFGKREDAIGVAQVCVQRWHSYDAIAHGYSSTLRIYDTEEERVVNVEESCEVTRAVKLAQRGIALTGER